MHFFPCVFVTYYNDILGRYMFLAHIFLIFSYYTHTKRYNCYDDKSIDTDIQLLWVYIYLKYKMGSEILSAHCNLLLRSKFNFWKHTVK